MIRSAAKNHALRRRADRRPAVSKRHGGAGGRDGGTTLALRRRLAAAAYARTASYDAAIASLVRAREGRDLPRRASRSPASLRRRCATARTRIRRPPSTSRRRRPAGHRDRDPAPGQGAELQQPERHRRRLRAGRPSSTSRAVAIVKHANPCGVAEGENLLEAWWPRAGLRSRQRLRRHHRAQPAAGRRHRRADRRAVRRGRDRARRRRGRARQFLAAKKNLRAAADRRHARPGGAPA